MTVRVQPARRQASTELRGRLERLEPLPVRAVTARQVMSQIPPEAGSGALLDLDWSKCRNLQELDPGWVLNENLSAQPPGPLEIVASRPWWPAVSAGSHISEAFQRLWRHSVAVGLATRWLARESNDPEPDRLVRAGFLHGLGRWAVASVDPEWLVRWLQEPDAQARAALELRDLGTDLFDLGRRLAERWESDPLVIEAAWLHDQPLLGLNRVASQPARLALIQKAFRWAESTPWSLCPTPERDTLPADPRLRILIAEVQSRCAAHFMTADSTTHEEKMTRQCARLYLRLHEERGIRASQDRLLQAMSDAVPTDSQESWARRAGALWCEEPEVTAARVIWTDVHADEEAVCATSLDDRATGPGNVAPGLREQPDAILPLHSRGRRLAEVQLWLDRTLPDIRQRLESTPLLRAWAAWGTSVYEHRLLEHRLRAVVASVRELGDEEPRIRKARLDGLAEFAAGAGHELNNPLAVIVGRAQLLLGKVTEPEMARSLRIILNQAQRTHRILRDLMFVARPGELRPRSCRPSELLRSCVDEFQQECEAQRIQLTAEYDQLETPTWADPDALCHIAETLLRNAVQATPSGGRIQVRALRFGDEVRWSISDSGKGITAAEGHSLFDPFYCGRQAGRGLGLGLPRAARIASMLGGSLNWASTPGKGSTFQIRLPLTPAPEQPETLALPVDEPLSHRSSSSTC